MDKYFIFTINNDFFALPLSCINTVVRAAQLVRLPEAAPELLGLLDLRGTLIPVIDIKQKLHLPTTPLTVEQRLVIAKHKQRAVAFVVDTVEDIEQGSTANVTTGNDIYPNMDHYVTAVIRVGEQKVLLCDPKQFLYINKDLP